MSEAIPSGEVAPLAPVEGATSAPTGLEGIVEEMGGAAPPVDPIGEIPTVPDWASEFSPELKDMISAKKYVDPESLAQAYLHAEKRLGVSPDKLLEIPDWDNPEASSKFFDAIGRPAEASGYTMVEGMADVDAAVANEMAGDIHALGLSDRQWQGVQAAFNKVGANGLANLEAASAEQIAADQSTLRTKWGADYENNLQLGLQAGIKVGINNEIAEGLKQVIGHKGTSEFLFQLSRLVGEHTMDFEGTSNTPGFGGTPDAARAEVKRMQRDPEIAKKYAANDPETVAKVNRLVEIYSRSEENVLR